MSHWTYVLSLFWTILLIRRYSNAWRECNFCRRDIFWGIVCNDVLFYNMQITNMANYLK